MLPTNKNIDKMSFRAKTWPFSFFWRKFISGNIFSNFKSIIVEISTWYIVKFFWTCEKLMNFKLSFENSSEKIAAIFPFKTIVIEESFLSKITMYSFKFDAFFCRDWDKKFGFNLNFSSLIKIWKKSEILQKIHFFRIFENLIIKNLEFRPEKYRILEISRVNLTEIMIKIIWWGIGKWRT